MPRPNGPQWRDAFGDEPQRAIALGIVNKAEGSLTPEQTKYVFRAANIRQWPIDQLTFDNYERTADEGHGYVEPDDVLHTNQSGLYAPAIRDYMQSNPADTPPEEHEEDTDNEYGDGDNYFPYLPEVIDSERGKPWIEEGHHRLVASRLMRKPQAWVAAGTMRKYW